MFSNIITYSFKLSPSVPEGFQEFIEPLITVLHTVDDVDPIVSSMIGHLTCHSLSLLLSSKKKNVQTTLLLLHNMAQAIYNEFCEVSGEDLIHIKKLSTKYSLLCDALATVLDIVPQNDTWRFVNHQNVNDVLIFVTDVLSRPQKVKCNVAVWSISVSSYKVLDALMGYIHFLPEERAVVFSVWSSTLTPLFYGSINQMLKRELSNGQETSTPIPEDSPNATDTLLILLFAFRSVLGFLKNPNISIIDSNHVEIAKEIVQHVATAQNHFPHPIAVLNHFPLPSFVRCNDPTRVVEPNTRNTYGVTFLGSIAQRGHVFLAIRAALYEAVQLVPPAQIEGNILNVLNIVADDVTRPPAFAFSFVDQIVKSHCEFNKYSLLEMSEFSGNEAPINVKDLILEDVPQNEKWHMKDWQSIAQLSSLVLKELPDTVNKHHLKTKTSVEIPSWTETHVDVFQSSLFSFLRPDITGRLAAHDVYWREQAISVFAFFMSFQIVEEATRLVVLKHFSRTLKHPPEGIFNLAHLLPAIQKSSVSVSGTSGSSKNIFARPTIQGGGNYLMSQLHSKDSDLMMTQNSAHSNFIDFSLGTPFISLLALRSYLIMLSSRDTLPVSYTTSRIFSYQRQDKTLTQNEASLIFSCVQYHIASPIPILRYISALVARQLAVLATGPLLEGIESMALAACKNEPVASSGLSFVCAGFEVHAHLKNPKFFTKIYECATGVHQPLKSWSLESLAISISHWQNFDYIDIKNIIALCEAQVLRCQTIDFISLYSIASCFSALVSQMQLFFPRENEPQHHRWSSLLLRCVSLWDDLRTLCEGILGGQVFRGVESGTFETSLFGPVRNYTESSKVAPVYFYLINILKKLLKADASKVIKELPNYPERLLIRFCTSCLVLNEQQINIRLADLLQFLLRDIRDVESGILLDNEFVALLICFWSCEENAEVEMAMSSVIEQILSKTPTRRRYAMIENVLRTKLLPSDSIALSPNSNVFGLDVMPDDEGEMLTKAEGRSAEDPGSGKESQGTSPAGKARGFSGFRWKWNSTGSTTKKRSSSTKPTNSVFTHGFDIHCPELKKLFRSPHKYTGLLFNLSPSPEGKWPVELQRMMMKSLLQELSPKDHPVEHSLRFIEGVVKIITRCIFPCDPDLVDLGVQLLHSLCCRFFENHEKKGTCKDRFLFETHAEVVVSCLRALSTDPLVPMKAKLIGLATTLDLVIYDSTTDPMTTNTYKKIVNQFVFETYINNSKPEFLSPEDKLEHLVLNEIEFRIAKAKILASFLQKGGTLDFLGPVLSKRFLEGICTIVKDMAVISLNLDDVDLAFSTHVLENLSNYLAESLPQYLCLLIEHWKDVHLEKDRKIMIIILLLSIAKLMNTKCRMSTNSTYFNTQISQILRSFKNSSLSLGEEETDVLLYMITEVKEACKENELQPALLDFFRGVFNIYCWEDVTENSYETSKQLTRSLLKGVAASLQIAIKVRRSNDFDSVISFMRSASKLFEEKVESVDLQPVVDDVIQYLHPLDILLELKNTASLDPSITELLIRSLTSFYRKACDLLASGDFYYVSIEGNDVDIRLYFVWMLWKKFNKTALEELFSSRYSHQKAIISSLTTCLVFPTVMIFDAYEDSYSGTLKAQICGNVEKFAEICTPLDESYFWKDGFLTRLETCSVVVEVLQNLVEKKIYRERSLQVSSLFHSLISNGIVPWSLFSDKTVQGCFHLIAKIIDTSSKARDLKIDLKNLLVEDNEFKWLIINMAEQQPRIQIVARKSPYPTESFLKFSGFGF
eukprot:GHVP01004909.1.p1 GENE.GHVP01004909.1~~GHVP01004909.1.p1  ORF type:complete len:1773 (-),score=281.73 GHVP01004909.1:1396-6714(-)